MIRYGVYVRKSGRRSVGFTDVYEHPSEALRAIFDTYEVRVIPELLKAPETK